MPNAWTKYAQDVTDGRVVACEQVKQAAARFLSDMERADLTFDADVAARVVSFFEVVLKHSKGEWAGDDIELESWEQFILANIFGWHNQDGTRRFRTAYVEIARKNGKTLLASGVGLYMMLLDGEGGAEVYSAATTREQARLSHGEAVRMVRQSRLLQRELKTVRDNIYSEATFSKFEPLSSDYGTLDGLNVHCALCDEVHAWKGRELWDILRTATGARRNPLMFAITTAGFDRQSLCYQLHDYTEKVLSGVVQDDTHFGIIYTIDTEPHSDIVQSSTAALRRLERLCNCNNVKTTQIEKYIQEACANRVTTNGTGIKIEGDARTTQTGQLPQEICAGHVTIGGSEKKTQNTKKNKTNTEKNGQETTKIGSEKLTKSGERKTSERFLTKGASKTMESPEKNTTPCMSSGVGVATSAEEYERFYAWTTATIREVFGDCSANDAIAESVFSEIVKRVYNAHSPTCEARTRCEIKGGFLVADMPADDWEDEGNWIKANPNLDVSKKRTDMRIQAAQAKEMPAALNAFLRLHLNVWTQAEDRWISPHVWAENDGAPGVGPGAVCYAGLDLSTTTDVSAFVMVFPDGDGYAVVPHFWIPEDNMRERERRDRVPFAAWVREGYVTATPGNVIDYAFILDHVQRMAREYTLREIAFDRWGATALVTQMQDAGLTVVEFGQGFASMSPPMKELEKLLLGGKLRHGGNPVLTWMADNVVARQDPAGNIKPDKQKSVERIDGIVALIMGLDRALRLKDDRSVYVGRGLRVL